MTPPNKRFVDLVRRVREHSVRGNYGDPEVVFEDSETDAARLLEAEWGKGQATKLVEPPLTDGYPEPLGISHPDTSSEAPAGNGAAQQAGVASQPVGGGAFTREQTAILRGDRERLWPTWVVLNLVQQRGMPYLRDALEAELGAIEAAGMVEPKSEPK